MGIVILTSGNILFNIIKNFRVSTMTLSTEVIGVSTSIDVDTQSADAQTPSSDRVIPPSDSNTHPLV